MELQLIVSTTIIDSRRYKIEMAEYDHAQLGYPHEIKVDYGKGILCEVTGYTHGLRPGNCILSTGARRALSVKADDSVTVET